MKGVSVFLTILLFALAIQVSAVLKRAGALPAQDRSLVPKAVLAPVAALPAHPQAPEASLNL